MDPRVRAAALYPPRTLEGVTEGGVPRFAPVGGRARCRPEDFRVEEIPAYAADGGGESGSAPHAFVALTKRSMTTEEAVRTLAKGVGVGRESIGVAGLKDRDAVTTQRVSVPGGPEVAAKLEAFRHRSITLGPAELHSHKLRRGHLRGNRFTLVLRGLACELEQAQRRAQQALERLAVDGVRNFYGQQRFGREGAKLEGGLARLGVGRRQPSRKGDFLVNVGQAALFNLYLAERARRDLEHRVLLGDIVQKRGTGGLFTCDDPERDQARLDAGELVITGPMFGAKMRAPAPGTPSAALEDEILAMVGLSRKALAGLGRRAPGTRRRQRFWPLDVSAARSPAAGALGPGLALGFELPAGCYATVVLRELTG